MTIKQNEFDGKLYNGKVANLQISISALTLNDSRLKIIGDTNFSNNDLPLSYFSFRRKEEILNNSELKAS